MQSISYSTKQPITLIATGIGLIFTTEFLRLAFKDMCDWQIPSRRLAINEMERSNEVKEKAKKEGFIHVAKCITSIGLIGVCHHAKSQKISSFALFCFFQFLGFSTKSEFNFHNPSLIATFTGVTVKFVPSILKDILKNSLSPLINTIKHIITISKNILKGGLKLVGKSAVLAGKTLAVTGKIAKVLLHPKILLATLALVMAITVKRKIVTVIYSPETKRVVNVAKTIFNVAVFPLKSFLKVLSSIKQATSLVLNFKTAA